MDTNNQVQIDSLNAEMQKVFTFIRSLNMVIDEAEDEKRDMERDWAKLHKELLMLRTTCGDNWVQAHKELLILRTTWEDNWAKLHKELLILRTTWEDNWEKLREELILLRTPWDYNLGIESIQYKRTDKTEGTLEIRGEFELRFQMSTGNRRLQFITLFRNPESGLLEADYSSIADEDNLLEYAKTAVLWFFDWFGHYPNTAYLDYHSWNSWNPVAPVEYESWKDSYIF